MAYVWEGIEKLGIKRLSYLVKFLGVDRSKQLWLVRGGITLILNVSLEDVFHLFSFLQ